MALRWTKENSPRWDEPKRAVFGVDDLIAVGMSRPADDAPIADEWWRVTDDESTIVGYGWLDSEWGDAQITFFVVPGHRGAGIGEFILDHLEGEAAARGLNYIYNVVPASHPDPSWISHWLSMHGFRESSRGQLRRQVPQRAQH